MVSDDPTSSHPRSRRALVVEDEALVAWELAQRLSEWGFEVCGVAARLADALVKAEKFRPHFALVDVNLQGGDDGVALARMLQEAYGILVIFVTGMDDATTAQRMAALAPAGCVMKPYGLVELRDAVEQVAARPAAAPMKEPSSAAARAAKPRILIVEDDPTQAEGLRDILAEIGFDVVGTATGTVEAVFLAQSCRPDLALVDITLAGSIDGITTGRHLAEQCDVRVVFLSGCLDDAVQQARDVAAGFLNKPYSISELKAVIATALRE